MKIIFLDIDGVLNSFEAGMPHDWSTPGSHLERSAKLIEKPKVALLNALIGKTHAKVVIHSSWRKAGSFYGWTPFEMQTILDMSGFKGEVIGETPKIFGLDGEQKAREYEIRKWIEDYPEKPESIVILDDIPMRRLDDVGDMEHWSIRTDSMNGLTEENIGVADIILEREFHICNRCNLVCGGAFCSIHDVKTNELKEAFCLRCDKKARIEKYEEDKVLTTKLLMDAMLDVRNLSGTERLLHPLYSVHRSNLELDKEVELFDEEVWFGGLAKFVREAKWQGYSAKFGDSKFMNYTLAGRSCTQLEKPDGTYINLIQLDEGESDLKLRKQMHMDERSRMGIQGICATEEEALELMREARATWKAGKIKLKKNKDVGMF